MKTSILLTGTIALFCLLFLHCQKQDVHDDRLKVFVSILPQKYFIDKIGGKLVDVSVMVLPGSSPHTYEPRPSQMKELSKARAYFSIGVEFENAWLPKFANMYKTMRCIHTDSLIEKMPADSAEAAEMRNAPISGLNPGPGLDPHIWLAPRLVKVQARCIYDALIKMDPAHEATYSVNYQAFVNELTTVHDTICRILECDSPGKPEKTFMVFHPSWAYFAREFGLRQIAIEVEGKEPGPRQLETVFNQALQNDIHCIFVQPQFSRQSAQAIARQLKAQVLVADDLAYDWTGNLLFVATAIARR
ncbi:MAG: zinc ABC transporter substrate-binding protein [Chitinivibrionales bacterium]